MKKPCKKCKTPTDELELFPNSVCLSCWAESPEGKRMPTAAEVVRLWGGSRR